MGLEVVTEWAREDSHPWMGIFRYAKMTAPIVGQLGGLVPAIHLISMSVPDVTNDSIKEIYSKDLTQE